MEMVWRQWRTWRDRDRDGTIMFSFRMASHRSISQFTLSSIYSQKSRTCDDTHTHTCYRMLCFGGDGTQPFEFAAECQGQPVSLRFAQPQISYGQAKPQFSHIDQTMQQQNVPSPSPPSPSPSLSLPPPILSHTGTYIWPIDCICYIIDVMENREGVRENGLRHRLDPVHNIAIRT